MDKDELDVSVAPSPVHSCLGYVSSKQAHLCCDLPVALAFASSRLKGNGQPRPFMRRGMLGSSQRCSTPPTPLCLPERLPAQRCQ